MRPAGRFFCGSSVGLRAACRWCRARRCSTGVAFLILTASLLSIVLCSRMCRSPLESDATPTIEEIEITGYSLRACDAKSRVDCESNDTKEHLVLRVECVNRGRAPARVHVRYECWDAESKMWRAGYLWTPSAPPQRTIALHGCVPTGVHSVELEVTSVGGAYTGFAY